jgi:predicted kinase
MKLTVKPKTLWVLIGPSGSGKSTVSNKIINQYPGTVVYSLDELRHRWYDAVNYRAAWEASMADTKFFSKAQGEYYKLLEMGSSIVLDNTNLNPKGRKFFISAARKHGYHIIGVVFNVPLDTLISRQSTRTDKTVSDEVVTRQFNDLKFPTLSEVDEVILADQLLNGG